MGFQTVFKRYELKYILTAEQKEKVLRAMEPYMVSDQYGRTVIRNIYFDTDDYRLIRRSIEKPAYKEKLRIRSYSRAEPEDLDYSEIFDDIFQTYTSACEMVCVKTTNMGSMFRLTYHVTLKNVAKEKEMLDKIRCRNGNLEISVSRQETMAAEL